MKPTLNLGTVCILFATCAGGAPPDDTLRSQIEEARRQLAAGDPDACLSITDRLRRERGDWAEAWLLAGEGNLALARIERSGLDPMAVLHDAETAFLRATALADEADAAWVGLAETRLALGNHEAARQAAMRAVELRSAGKQPTAAIAAALRIAADCDLRELTLLRQQEVANGTPDARGLIPPERATLALAQQALVRYEAVQQGLPEAGFCGTAAVYRQIGQNDQALLELERGIAAAPDAGAVHIAYQDLLGSLGQQRALRGAYARFCRENPGAPVLLWYQGRAEVVLGDDLRGKQSFHPAIEAYQKALSSYGQYAAMMPAHRATTAQWLAICELSIARAACDAGDLDTSKEHLFAAAAACPETTEYDGMTPRLVDSFGSHFAGVVFALGRALASGGDDALAATLQFHEQVIERFPGKWGFVYNNAALPARDLGVRLARDLAGLPEDERRARLAQAMALWEKSYRYYEEAARLSPDDPRILNDCGLMLVYHLNRSIDRARELFDRAIAVGQQQLDALPADAPIDERHFLEEAVGDAWQNIGILLGRHQQRPFAEQQPFYQRAVQFYPGQQREAARLLAAAGRETALDASAPQGGAAESFAKVKAAVEAAGKDNDLDGAMAALDKAQKELKAYAPYQALRGDYALRYAKSARDEGRKGVEFLFADAVQALQKAVELDGEPAAPRQLLAEAQFESGAFADAVRTTTALLLHMQSQGGAGDAAAERAHRVLADAASKAVMVDPAGQDTKQFVADARLSFRWLEKRGALDPALTKAWADLETTARAPAEAVGVWTRALARAPEDLQALAAVVDAAFAAGQPQLAVEALAQRTDAAGLWYLGRARFLAASDLRIAGNFDGTYQELDRARGCFEQSMAKNKEFADSCQQWIAITLGKKGNAALAQKKYADAETWLLESVRLRPDQIGQDLGLQETTKLGVMLLADHYLQQQDLGKAEAIYRAATDAAFGDLDLLNNAGLFARDHGAQLLRDGKDAEAKPLFEQSYRAYGKALQLDPTNVQLRNDYALIAIYYLDRDWDENKKLLDAAIQDGEQRLSTLAAGDAERQPLESAVGDCWENVALWHLRRDHDAAAAKKAAERSLQLFPGASRQGARRHLRDAEQLLQEKK